MKIWINCPVCSVRMKRVLKEATKNWMFFDCRFCKGRFQIETKQYKKWKTP